MNDRFLSGVSANIYFSNITWLMGERVVRLAVTAAVGVYVARYLGPQQFGLLAFAQSYLAIFLILASLGLDGVVVRELVNKPQDQAVVLGSAFMLKIVGSIILWACLGVSLMLFNFSAQDNLLIAILAAGVVFQSLSVIDFYFQSRIESKYVARAQLAQLILSAGLKLILIFSSADLVWFALVITMDHLFLAVGLYLIFRKKGGDVTTWRFKAPVARQLLSNSAPVLFYAFFVLALMNSDQIMIKVLRSEAEVGWYAAAAMISSVWYFVPVALGSTFNPYFIKHSDRGVTDEKIRLLFSTLFALTVLGALAIYFAAPLVIKLLFGADYQPAAPILTVLILNGVFVFHVSIRSRILLALEKQSVSSVIMLAALVLNVAGNLLLIPNYGAVGAAWSSVIAWGASVILLPLMFSAAKPFVGIFALPRLSGFRNLIDAVKS